MSLPKQPILKNTVVWVPADFGHPPIHKVPPSPGGSKLSGLEVLIAEPNGQGKFLVRTAFFNKEGQFWVQSDPTVHSQVFPTLWSYIPVPDYEAWIAD